MYLVSHRILQYTCIDRRIDSHFQPRDGNSKLAHITFIMYEDMRNWWYFQYFLIWTSRLNEISSPQFKVDLLVMIWYMIRIHLSWKVEPSFLPNTLHNNITMIGTLFLNLEFFHSVDADFTLNCPLNHHPFIIVRKSADSFFFLSHSGVTLIWASLRWYIWLKMMLYSWIHFCFQSWELIYLPCNPLYHIRTWQYQSLGSYFM